MSGFGFLGVGYARKNPLPFPYGNESMQLRDEILRDFYALLWCHPICLEAHKNRIIPSQYCLQCIHVFIGPEAYDFLVYD